MKIENIGLKHHITVDAKTLQKFEYILAQKYSLEFTAFCHAEKREEGEYHIYDIFFPRQDNAATTTECDSADIIALMKDGADISKLTGHIHSHVNMGVFASGTDDKDIVERAKDCGYNVALIMNKKGEIYGHIADTTIGIHVKDVDVFINYPFEEDEYEDSLMEQIKKAETLAEVQILARFSMHEYFEMYYPLSSEEEFELDTIIKERFKTKSYNYGKKNNVPALPISNQAVKTFLDNKEIEVEEVDYQDVYGTGNKYPMDIYSQDEFFDYIESLHDKPIGDMTAEEWDLYDRYYNGSRYD